MIRPKPTLQKFRFLRSHYYIQLVSLWGDIPYFTSAVTEEQTKQVSRTPWKEVVDDILKTLDEAAD
ncbi:RagB/SusD family nutrient uptake outer membrane protein, partial [Bacteroides ovatus]|uniref:RagB/SusD family nutrient uptake outer membrane protein n=1 Tax=Bacteroides ovatus TaxID=28116 RepID=UPI001EE6FE50